MGYVCALSWTTKAFFADVSQHATPRFLRGTRRVLMIQVFGAVASIGTFALGLAARFTVNLALRGATTCMCAARRGGVPGSSGVLIVRDLDQVGTLLACIILSGLGDVALQRVAPLLAARLRLGDGSRDSSSFLAGLKDSALMDMRKTIDDAKAISRLY